MVLFALVNLTIDRSDIYLCNAITLFLALSFHFLFFPVCDVSIFVGSGNLDKKFGVLCHANLTSKAVWSNVLSVVGEYIQFVLLLIFIFPITEVVGWFSPRGYKASWEESITHDFLYTYLNQYSFLQISKIYCSPDLLMSLICWTISSSPGISEISLALVTFVDGLGCCLTTVWWSLLGISILIIGVIVVLFVPTLDRGCCYLYKLIRRCSVIALKYPGLEGYTLKSY